MRPRGRVRLVGRAEELAALLALCTGDGGAGVGRGGVAVLTGEAGSGKTRLLTEVAERVAAAGTRVSSGHAVPGCGAYRPLVEALVRVAPPDLGEDPRLVPFRAVLARILPGWPAGPSGGAHVVDPVIVLGEAVLELLGLLARERPCVLLLDDLHWADADTLALLEYLAGALARLPVRVLVATRTDGSDPEGLAALRRHPAVPEITLPGLPPADVGLLARRSTGAVFAPEVETFLVAACDGLPLLVEELAAGLIESGAVRRDPGGWRATMPLTATVPGAFARLVERRMAALSPVDRDVLRSAAVLGSDLDWLLLPAVTGMDRDRIAATLRAAVDAGLLIDLAATGSDAPGWGTGAVGWRHALTRDAVLDSLTAPERTVLAAGAAEALDGDPEVLPGARLALVADLWERGAHPDRAALLLVAMARQHIDRAALAAARVDLDRAAGLAVSTPGLRTAIATQQVRVLALSARTDEAVAVADAALPTAPPADRTTLAVVAARACVAAERFADAARYLDLVPDGDDPAVLALAAHIALGRSEIDRALVLAAAAARAGETAGRPEAVCEALEVTGRALRRPDPAGAEAALVRSAKLAERHGLVPWRIRALSELAVVDVFGAGTGEPIRRAAALAVDAGMLGTATVLDLQSLLVTIGSEGLVAVVPEAQRCAERAARLRLPGPQAHALMLEARGQVYADRTDLVGALLDEAERIAPHTVHIEAARAGDRGYDAWLSGDDAGAARELDTAVGTLLSVPGTNPAPVWGMWALLHTVVDPGVDGPRSELRRSDVLVNPINAAALHYADALVAARSAGPDRATDLIAAGDVLLTNRPFFRYHLRAMLLPHAGEDGLGDPAPFLREATAWLAGTGEVRLTELCRRHLRRLGLPVPRPARDRPLVQPRLRALGVTARELEVLGLVARGESNPEIAARLHLSRRTVESHVGNLLAKTGATSRRDLGRRLDP